MKINLRTERILNMHLSFKEYPQRGEEMSMPVPEKLPPGPSLTITAPPPQVSVYFFTVLVTGSFILCVSIGES